MVCIKKKNLIIVACLIVVLFLFFFQLQTKRKISTSSFAKQKQQSNKLTKQLDFIITPTPIDSLCGKVTKGIVFEQQGIMMHAFVGNKATTISVFASIYTPSEEDDSFVSLEITNNFYFHDELKQGTLNSEIVNVTSTNPKIQIKRIVADKNMFNITSITKELMIPSVELQITITPVAQEYPNKYLFQAHAWGNISGQPILTCNPLITVYPSSWLPGLSDRTNIAVTRIGSVEYFDLSQNYTQFQVDLQSKGGPFLWSHLMDESLDTIDPTENIAVATIPKQPFPTGPVEWQPTPWLIDGSNKDQAGVPRIEPIPISANNGNHYIAARLRMADKNMLNTSSDTNQGTSGEADSYVNDIARPDFGPFRLARYFIKPIYIQNIPLLNLVLNYDSRQLDEKELQLVALFGDSREDDRASTVVAPTLQGKPSGTVYEGDEANSTLVKGSIYYVSDNKLKYRDFQVDHHTVQVNQDEHIVQGQDNTGILRMANSTAVQGTIYSLIQKDGWKLIKITKDRQMSVISLPIQLNNIINNETVLYYYDKDKESAFYFGIGLDLYRWKSDTNKVEIVDNPNIRSLYPTREGLPAISSINAHIGEIGVYNENGSDMLYVAYVVGQVKGLKDATIGVSAESVFGFWRTNITTLIVSPFNPSVYLPVIQKNATP